MGVMEATSVKPVQGAVLCFRGFLFFDEKLLQTLNRPDFVVPM